MPLFLMKSGPNLHEQQGISLFWQKPDNILRDVVSISSAQF